MNTQSPQILFSYNTLAWTRVFVLDKNKMVGGGYLGIIPSNPLKYIRSKQTSGDFGGSRIIPSNLLKYTRSKQDLKKRDWQMHGEKLLSNIIFTLLGLRRFAELFRVVMCE